MTDEAERLRSAALVADAAWGIPEPAPRRWAHGPWSVEVRGDELAEVRHDGALVLRSIRVVARDRDWSTVPVEVEGTSGSEYAGVGILRLDLRLRGLGADLAATLRMEAGDALTVHLGLESRSDFLTCRTGLVVLHPPSAAGRPLTVISDGGGRIATAFPRSIAPHQPALDIRALEWTTPERAAAVRFAGDVFEMEDQRNWTDASFKTYSGPLSRPLPVTLAAGQRVEQSVTVTAAARPEMHGADSGSGSGSGSDHAVPTLRLRSAGTAFPSVGLGASTAPDAALAGAPAPAADTLLVELDARSPAWRAALHRAGAEAQGARLDVRLVATDPAELPPLLDAVATIARAGALARLGVFSATTQVTEPALWDALVAGAAERELESELLGGARSHFTELNRTHQRLPDGIPALVFSVTPQMHASERAQLVESISMQRTVAEDAVRIATGRPVHVGPVTLRNRYNAAAATGQEPGDREDLRDGYGAELVASADDPRQQSPALAAWTVASAAALAVPGVASVSWFETVGPRGIRAASAFPVAEALAWLHELSGLPLLSIDGASDASGLLWAVGAVTPAGPVALVANLRSEPAELRIELDGTPWGAGAPLSIPPLTALRLT